MFPPSPQWAQHQSSQTNPVGHIKPWMSPRTKAFGGLRHASRASMEMVCTPRPQWPNQLWEDFLLPSLPFLFSSCSDHAGVQQRRGGREKAHAFTSASHAHKEKNEIAQTCTHAYTNVWPHACTHIHTPLVRGLTMGMCEKTRITDWFPGLRTCS